MTRTVHAIHGWGERNQGASTVARYTPHFAALGLEARLLAHEWPWLRTCALVRQRRTTQTQAERLAERLKSGEGLFAFSNGNVVVRQALALAPHVHVPVWVAVAPALPRVFDVPANVGHVIVLHATGDRAVRWGWVWMWLNPLQWADRDWGRAGRDGYLGDDPRVENWLGRDGATHGSWFDPEPVSHWGPRIADAMATTMRAWEEAHRDA